MENSLVGTGAIFGRKTDTLEIKAMRMFMSGRDMEDQAQE